MRQKPILQYLFAFIFLIIAGCAGLPTIIPLDNAPAPDIQPVARELDLLFPSDAVQFVHALELTLQGGHSAMLMGVVNIHPRQQAIHCVIMTLEGLVLFDADHTSERFTINRAIPPFDSRALAQGLVSDIELIFFTPRGTFEARGKLENKSRILRFSEPDGGILDIVSAPDRTIWTQTLRTPRHRITRRVTYLFSQRPADSRPFVFPKSITLTAAFPSRYTLTMTLTDANLLPDTNLGGDHK